MNTPVAPVNKPAVGTSPAAPVPAKSLETKNGEVQASKFDQGKVRFSLLPARAKEAVAKVFSYGAEKYAVGNWHQGNGFDWSRLQDASERHANAFALGEDNDPESGLPHLAHKICCDMMLLEHQLTDHGIDDRDESQYHPVETKVQPKDNA